MTAEAYHALPATSLNFTLFLPAFSLNGFTAGSLGVADRWADLAIASWSLEWDYGPGHERPFWDAYGIEPDPERIALYRRLWDEPDPAVDA